MNYSSSGSIVDEFPLGRMLIAAKQRWVTILFGGLFGGLCGVAAVFVVTPAYRAEVITVYAASANDATGLNSLVRGLGGGLSGILSSGLQPSGAKIQQDIALIRSRAFTLDFVKRQDLLPALFPERWDGSTNTWIARRSWLLGGGNETGEPTEEEVFRRMDSRRQVILTPVSELVAIRVEWGDAGEAARLANEMVVAANEYGRRRVSEESTRSMQYLDRQLESAQVLGLRDMLYGLYEEQVKRAMLAEVRDDFMLSVIDPAVTPERMIRPRPLLYSASGIMLGLCFAFLFVVLKPTHVETILEQR